VPATAIEHEAEEKTSARGAESQPKHGAAPVAELGGGPLGPELAAAPLAEGEARAPQAIFHPRLLLGLQARAGNAAVAQLIESRRKPAPSAAIQPTTLPAAAAAPQSPQPAESSPAGALATDAEPPTESATKPRAGETDDALVALDAAADMIPVAGESEPGETQERVARDAQAELAEAQAPSSSEPSEAPGGAAEPGVPIEAHPPPVARDVSTAEPSAGLAAVAGLPPAQLLGSLGSVAAAVDRDVTHAHKRLAASPPERPRHPGAPPTVEAPASTRIPLVDRPTGDVPKVREGRDAEVRRPDAPPVVPETTAPNGQLPTHDPGLELKPGPLPHLPLEGTADPAVVQQQHSHVLSGMEREHAAGQRDAAQPMGEDEIFPTVPAETLRAAVAEAPGANGHGSPPAAEDDDAASIVAQQEKGGEIQSAVSGGLASLAAQRQEHAQHTTRERAKADAEMAQLEQANAELQTGERAVARREVRGLRQEWSGAQQELVAGARRDADAKTSETAQTITQERGAAEQQAAAHYEQGKLEADQARREGEQHAAAERKKAEGQSPAGLLGAIGSAAQSLFDKAKQAVQGVFDKARQLVRSAIERAQQLATDVMERARQAIVGAIRLTGSALVAIGDRVLVAFPALRDRYRKAIQDRIAAAEAVVNKLATALKQAVQSALNLLGAALSAAIGLLSKGMQAAIDGVRPTVRGALDFARSAISAFGTFAVLVKDIAANPRRWISNLAASAHDGIRNHLWPDLKAGVQGWFNEKVDAILGLGAATWNLLRRGGVQAAQVANFAWEAIKSMIPQTVVWVLIEKLVALIVPAAAAVMLIIQALQAAWGSLGRILQAFDAFIAFLKGVRWGNAGGLFGKALAAGAVAVIEFISQFLFQRLMGAAGAVAGKLRALAKRIGSRLAAAGRGIARAGKFLAHSTGRAVRAFGRVGRNVGKTSARGLAAIGHSVKRAGTRIAVRWHVWRLERELQGEKMALMKLGQVKVDALDPAVKLDYVRMVRASLRNEPEVPPRDLMWKVILQNSERFSLKGRQLTADEIKSVLPLRRLTSLRTQVYPKMLKDEIRKAYPSFEAWRDAVRRGDIAFNPSTDLDDRAEVGRWLSQNRIKAEKDLETAITTRQLTGQGYEDGAVWLTVRDEAALKAELHKPTALDGMLNDYFQLHPEERTWGLILTTSDGESVILREAVTKPVAVSDCDLSSSEVLWPSDQTLPPTRTPSNATALAGGVD